MDFYDLNETNRIRTVSRWVVDIAAVLAFAWFCLHSFGTQVTVAGQSMCPLLDSGDVVLMNRLSYDLGRPSREDIVVFERGDGKRNVKRVMGVPGDVIQIRDGWLYVNGERYDDAELGPVLLPGLAESPVELGKDEYFLLGDNRDSSEDSRFSGIGNVKREQIMGKVWLRLFPLVKIRLIRS